MTWRRALASLAVLAAVATACASDDEPTLEAPDSTLPSDSTTPTTSGTPSSPTSGAASGTTATTAPTTRRTIIVGGTDAVPDGGAKAVGTGSPGDGAARLLRPAGAARIVVQVLAQDGAAPPQQVLDHVRRVLADASGKPVGVVGGGTPPARQTWSPADLRAAAVAGSRPSAPDEGLIHLLFVRGSSDRGPETLGLAVASDVVGVFSERVDDAARGLVTTTALMDAVTLHEVGHVLGLVDLVLKTGRADPDHPGHSSNPGSVMYWAVESSVVSDLLTGGPPREFDDRDRADLAAIRDG